MRTDKTAAIGDHSSVILFRAAGVKTISVQNAREAADAITALVKDGYEMIFLSEKYAADTRETINQYRQSVYPVILTVPDREGSTGYAADKLKINMEKAIGRNIFDES